MENTAPTYATRTYYSVDGTYQRLEVRHGPPDAYGYRPRLLIKKLKESGIKVYSIGLTRELDGDRLIKPTPREKAENFLKKIAKETGGRAVISSSKKLDVDKLLDELLAQ